MVRFLTRLLMTKRPTPRFSVRLSADPLEARESPAVVSGRAALIALSPAGLISINPQPLPPGRMAAINPQPLPPGLVAGINPQPLPPGLVWVG